MHEEFKQWGMRTSVAKTKVLVASAVPDDSPASSFQLDEQPLDTVQVFRYLGSVFTAGNSLDAEISNRIQSAAGAFNKLQKIGFWKSTISLRLKTRIFKTCVLSRLLYGCETWALTQNLLHRLETFVLSCLQNILW